MRFRQKPPTKPGRYWALPTNDARLELVSVIPSPDGLIVDNEDGDYGISMALYRLWSANPIAPENPPAFTVPRRWLNYHKPVKVALPRSCRRWGHKWVFDGDACAANNESIKHASTGSPYQRFGIIFGPDTFLKCSRCNAKDVSNSRFRNMFSDELFGTSAAKTATEVFNGCSNSQGNEDPNHYSNYGLSVKLPSSGQAENDPRR